MDGKPHAGGLPKPKAVLSKSSGDRELRRHANPPLRATVGTGGITKARVLDVERLGYWLIQDEFSPGEKKRPDPLVGSKRLVEWSELDESGHASSPTKIARASNAGAAENGVDKEAAKSARQNGPPKQKRDGPRKPDRRRRMVPPAPSTDKLGVAGISTNKIGIEDGDRPKQKRKRSSSASEMESASPASLSDDASSLSQSSPKISNSTAPSDVDQESIPSPKSPSLVSATHSAPAALSVAPADRANGGGQAVVGEQKPNAREMPKVVDVGTKQGQKPSASATAIAGKELEKKRAQSEAPIKQTLGGSALVAKRERNPGETHGLPKSSDSWLLPQSEHIPLSHTSAVQHKPPPQKFKLKIPNYQRLLTIPNEAPGEPPHILVLSVAASTIPNGGRGLYCTYRGPNAYWKVSNYVDLGCYGPHTANDIKRDNIMEIKNFRKWRWRAQPFELLLALDSSSILFLCNLFLSLSLLNRYSVSVL